MLCRIFKDLSSFFGAIESQQKDEIESLTADKGCVDGVRKETGKKVGQCASSFCKVAAVSGLMIGYTAGVGQRGETRSECLLFIKLWFSLSFSFKHVHI